MEMTTITINKSLRRGFLIPLISLVIFGCKNKGEEEKVENFTDVQKLFFQAKSE